MTDFLLSRGRYRSSLIGASLLGILVIQIVELLEGKVL